jgi:hypothetical protein
VKSPPLSAAGALSVKQQRIALRSRLWRLSSLPSLQSCAKSVLEHQGFVGVEVGAGGVGLTGLRTCSSVSACPVCSARIRETRARQIEAVGVAHLRRGGQLVFATLTLPHDTGDDLKQLLRTVVEGWHAVQMSYGWRALARECGIEMAARAGTKAKRRLAFVRAVEITHGRSGWHPHLHVLIFAEQLTRAQYADLVGVVTSRWQDFATSQGWRLPEQLDFQRIYGVRGREGLLRYLSKVQDGFQAAAAGWGIHREMTRGDRKRGRRWHTRTPFQLAAGAADGFAGDLLLWHEYERATKGLRVIQPSQGLYRHLGAAEVADELCPDVQGETVTVAEVLPDDWRLIVRFRAIGDLLGAALIGGAPACYDLIDRLRGWQRALDFARRREEEQRPIQGLSPVSVLADYRRAREQAA